MKVCYLSIALLAAMVNGTKILCLHGGGGNGAGFCQSAGVVALGNSFPNVEFVCPDAGYGTGSSYLWVEDPPGGKDNPTTDPDIAAASMSALDLVVAQQGPFFGILGYSQGSMFVSAYLSHAPADTFQTALMFAGYNPLTHLGLLDSINAASPFNDVEALVWIGEQDTIITNSLTEDQGALYTNPTIVRSPQGGHVVPDASDSTFAQVVAFLQLKLNSVCGDSVCEGSETCISCPADCPTTICIPGASYANTPCTCSPCSECGGEGASADCTLAQDTQCFCGDGICNGAPGALETCATCPTDCCVCGDSICEEGEDCIGCPADCPRVEGPSCGDGTCDTGSGETCENCAQDCSGQLSGKPATRFCCGENDPYDPIGCDSRCGTCTTQASPPSSCCGQDGCTGTESFENCPVDCPAPAVCGDGSCDAPGEDPCSCEADCGVPSSATESSCTDGEDNDCDGLVDCDDTVDCGSNAACTSSDCLPRRAKCSTGVCCNGCDRKGRFCL